MENVAAKHANIPINTAWHLPFGEILSIIKFSNDTAAANYLQQEADIRDAQNEK